MKVHDWRIWRDTWYDIPFYTIVVGLMTIKTPDAICLQNGSARAPVKDALIALEIEAGLNYDLKYTVLLQE